MVDNTGKINFNLKRGMQKSQCTTYAQEEIFNIFDFNQNDKIDDYELKIFTENFGKKSIEENKVSEYAISLKNNQNDKQPLVQYLMKLSANKEFFLNTNFADLRNILTKENILKLSDVKYSQTHFFGDTCNSFDIPLSKPNYLDITVLDNTIKIYTSEGELVIYSNGEKEITTAKGKDTSYYPDNSLVSKSNFRKVYSKTDKIFGNIMKAIKENKLDANNLNDLNQYNVYDVLTQYQKTNHRPFISELLKKEDLKPENIELAKHVLNLLCENRKNDLLIDNDSIETMKNQVYSKFEATQNVDLLIEFENILSNTDKLQKLILSENISPQINNSHYNGEEYDVKIDGDNIELTNKKTNEKNNLNIGKLVSNLPLETQLYLYNYLKGLPAEVLVDVCNEVTLTEDKEFFSKYSELAAGAYTPGNDTLGMDLQDGHIANYKTFVHEIGHALDYMNGQSTFLSKYEDTFLNERQKYVDAGNKISDLKDFNENSYYNYCTYSIGEMFAECYTLLMLGDCKSKDCILQYFPDTLENVKKHLEWIRQQEQEVRHKK